ncbi:hypothetical protein RLOC_00010195 [Lonchura striata]|uniref:Uncharacterized protein n=1 Tax=Lonchura striata TaxID=40157 RepID=A0A218UUL8_9PASE|nr:hypothetical protein RLOC_00010195 [Lonchura striata domestica]
MTSRWRATRSSRGSSPRPTNGLITTRWSASAGTTSKIASTACGILCPHSKERRHPGPKSWTKPQSTSSTCAGKTTHTSRTSTTSSGRMHCWSSKCVRWRRPEPAPSSRPAIPRTTASTPTPRAVPSPPSTVAPTPAPTRSPTSRRTGRSCAWRPVRPLRRPPACGRTRSLRS